jgi:phage/conjugal plasmid C-4 type zinc finger TraR family protein
MDFADIASERQAEFLTDCLATVRRALESDGRVYRYCVDCEAEIPAKRRAAVPGVMRCLDCAAAVE